MGLRATKAQMMSAGRRCVCNIIVQLKLTLPQVTTYETYQQLMNRLRHIMNNQNTVNFSGSCEVPEDPLMSMKERTGMVTHDVWKVSGYRFTYVPQL
jgi:hypothetical protein